MNVPNNENIKLNSYDYIATLWGVSRKLQDDITTDKHVVKYTMLVDTTVHPGL